MSKIFVSGASGGIGNHLVKHLKSKGHEIILPKNPSIRLDDSNYFDVALDPSEIHFFYHLAGKCTVQQSWETPVDYFQTNVVGTAKVLEFCRKNQIKLVYMSSYMYGVPEKLPISEQAKVSVLNPYALSKYQGEELCEFYGRHYGLSYSIVRLFNLYGVEGNQLTLIEEIVRQISAGRAIHIKDLSPRRDYLYISDLLNFLELVATDCSNEIYNLGSGISYSVGEVVSICQQVWGTNLEVICEKANRKNEIPETVCDYSKAQKQLGWSPKISFQEGIKLMKENLK
jgi:nucleoside-diphosphate-sugar epimerase